VIEQPEEPRRVYLVAGGTPAARRLAEFLDDPETRARMEADLQRFAEQYGLLVSSVSEALARAVEQYRPLLESVSATLRDAGVLPEQPPEDPRERALWLRQHRGAGPDRQLQHRPRPRRIA
jgi:hypothetical protein